MYLRHHNRAVQIATFNMICTLYLLRHCFDLGEYFSYLILKCLMNGNSIAEYLLFMYAIGLLVAFQFNSGKIEQCSL